MARSVTFGGALHAGIVLLTCALAAPSGLPRAETLRYALTVPDRQSVTYELELPVSHPGLLNIHAVWSGRRMLSFRLDPPGSSTTYRRSGVSPQYLEAEVSPETLGQGPWKLSIYALPYRGAAEGTLTVKLPDPRELRVEPKPTATPVAPTVELERWMRAREEPPGGSAEEILMFRATEHFRAMLTAPGAAMDACRWQSPFLRFLVDQRDGTAAPPDSSTRRLLERFADAIAGVEELRSSSDPMIAGPPPEDPAMRATWVRVRSDRIHDLESDLDDLLNAVEDGFAPELESSEWPGRLASCLTACERHFEERVRVGEERAVNRELARAQWERLIAAEQALRRLLAFRTGNVVVTPRFRVR